MLQACRNKLSQLPRYIYYGDATESRANGIWSLKCVVSYLLFICPCRFNDRLKGSVEIIAKLYLLNGQTLLFIFTLCCILVRVNSQLFEYTFIANIRVIIFLAVDVMSVNDHAVSFVLRRSLFLLLTV